MNTEGFKTILNTTVATLNKLSDTKGQEYSQQQEDRLSNFKRLSDTLGILPEKVLWVYFSKHLDSIANWVNELEKLPKERMHPSEPIDGRIDDAILYLILLKGLLRDRYMDESINKIRVDEILGGPQPSIPNFLRDVDPPPGCP